MQGVQISKAAKKHESDLTYQYSKTLKEKKATSQGLGLASDKLTFSLAFGIILQ